MTTRLRPFRFVLATLSTATLCAAATASATVASWTTGASFPTPVVRANGAWFPTNGRFYVLGGRQSDAAGSDLQFPQEYDPGLNTWTTKAGVFLDNQVCNMVCAVLTEGGTPYVFCVGGSAAAATTCTNAVRRYDPVADVMTTVATDPWSGAPANTLPGGGAVHNNKLYVIGGFTINVAMTAEIWEFDPNGTAGSKWTLKTSALPLAMGYVPCATVGNKIYIAGGSTYVTTPAVAILDNANSYVFDPVADTIGAITNIPRATGETRAVNEGGKVWVLGGGRVAPNPSTQVDDYATGPNTWSLGPPFALARRNIAADVDPVTGDIYMVGGYAPTLATASMEIFLGSISPGVAYCDPGTGGVLACPCGNTPGGAGRGCNNSLGTGGASISASGTASLATDTVVISASGIGSTTGSCSSSTDTLTWILLQGDGNAPAGLGFNDGVRCFTGTLKRIQSGTTVAGVAASTASISAQSSTLGDPIAASTSRYYGMWYRDPCGTFACAAPVNSNVSNSYSVLWGP